MPRTTARPLRQVLQPMIAGAVLATSHPALTADSIEVDRIEDGVGLRVFLYHSAPGQFEQWASAIGAPDLGAPRQTSRANEMSRQATGRIGTTPVEVTCVTLPSEWVWRAGDSPDVHARDRTNHAVARCGRTITGAADPAHWDLLGHRCTDCFHADIGGPM
ncbi:hypothetical protein ACFWVC_26900 [Streptomyces sp. NPDC058691]|uniref:hypothetical protein n=1 Tax=Streptomyces sp. NPDC058691 TaxID=3346601 RepID=UPI00366377B5